MSQSPQKVPRRSYIVEPSTSRGYKNIVSRAKSDSLNQSLTTPLISLSKLKNYMPNDSNLDSSVSLKQTEITNDGNSKATERSTSNKSSIPAGPNEGQYRDNKLLTDHFDISRSS